VRAVRDEKLQPGGDNVWFDRVRLQLAAGQHKRIGINEPWLDVVASQCAVVIFPESALARRRWGAA
jgi:hypothetical protein